MSKLSAVIIAKDEEEMIEDCLKSVSFCDEILLIDGGSKDKTAVIAKELGAKVIECVTNDFSKMRNAGLAKAKSDWILYIDAGERVSKELMHAITVAIFDKNNSFSAYRIKRKNFYYGNYPFPNVEHLERLFLKSHLKSWYGQLHESPKVIGKIGELEGFLVHFSHRDLSSMLKKTNSWSETEAWLRYRAGHPTMTWWRFPRIMLSTFFNSYFRQQGWRVGTPGLIESIYQSFSSFVTYAKLWELQNESKNQNAKIKRTK